MREPLVWKRGWFRAPIEYRRLGTTVLYLQVEGLIASPFAICGGGGYTSLLPYDWRGSPYVLVHLLSGRTVERRDKQRECVELAETIWPLDVAWEEADPQKVLVGPDVQKVRWLALRKWKRH
jgi:hypothetical protein